MEAINLGLLFEKICDQHFSRMAIQLENGNAINYEDLNKKVNQFSRFLKKMGVQNHDVVAIFNNKELHGFICILACLKIGATYVNLDSANPVDRIQKIIETCKPKLIFFNAHFFECNITTTYADALLIDYALPSFYKTLDALETTNLIETKYIHSNTVAYIMFTSGSTGFPKGAAMTHANVMHFINWSQDRFSITPSDVIANVNPIYFDNAVFDFYSALFTGAMLAPISPATLKKPRELLDHVNKTKCTIWFSVPSLLIYFLNIRILKETDFINVKKIIFGGEGFPKRKLKAIFDLFSTRINFINVYGPTECTCICSSYDVHENDLVDINGILPLGSINPNFDYLILDSNQNKVTDGEIGELCLLGPCVGKGYYANASLTARSFIQNPYSHNLPETMYCTGDLVFKNIHTQKLNFVARKDNQIKYQGYRIELEEIETALYRFDYIDEAITTYLNTDQNTHEIRAIVVTNTDKTEIDIIQDLRKILPEYMIPRKIYFKTMLPKNQNGKIDRAQLKMEYALL